MAVKGRGIKIWDAETFASISEVDNNDVSRVCYDHSGLRIVSGHFNGLLRIWSNKLQSLYAI